MAPSEQEGKNGDLNKYLIISLISTAVLCVVFAGVNYLVMENLLSQKISTISVSNEELEEDAGEAVTSPCLARVAHTKCDALLGAGIRVLLRSIAFLLLL